MVIEGTQKSRLLTELRELTYFISEALDACHCYTEASVIVNMVVM